jgi:hypothetical protein
MNLSDIKSGTHFICGPFNEKVDINQVFKDFAAKEEVINSFGINTYNPVEFYRQMGSDGFRIKHFLNIQVAFLAMCEKVVTLDEWDNCPEANKIVDIARIMGKEVVSFSAFTLKHSKHG